MIEQQLIFKPLRRYATTLLMFIIIIGSWFYLYKKKINKFIHIKKTEISALISQQKKLNFQLNKKNKTNVNIFLLKKKINNLTNNELDNSSFLSFIMHNLKISGLNLNSFKNNKTYQSSQKKDTILYYETTGNIKQINTFLTKINKFKKHLFICKKFSLNYSRENLFNFKCTLKKISKKSPSTLIKS